MIRVAVQAWLPADRYSGARTRLTRLITALDTTDLAVDVLTSSHAAPDVDLLRAARSCGARLRSVAIPPWPTWRRALAETRVLPRLLHDYDVFDMQSLPLPRVPAAVVLTIHDLRDLGPWARGVRRRFAARIVARALARATRVLVPSPHVAGELRARLPAWSGDIDCVPAPVEVAPRDLWHGPNGWPERYFVHLGRPEPRKNLDALVDAYARVTGPDFPALVLAGDAADADWTPLRERVAALGCANRVVFAGRLAPGELWPALAGALALVMPSRLEGFGLPVLEALAVGTPVVVTSGGPPAWIAGSAGLEVDGPEAWGRALTRIVTEPELRARLAAQTRTRAAEFGAASCARAWAASWRQAI